METWWKDHYGRPQDPEWHKWINIYADLVTKKNQELVEVHSNIVDGEKVFGMSKAAGCTRANAINYVSGAQYEESGSTNFTFWLGHTVEIATLATFIACGYDVEFQKEVSVKDSNGTTVMASKSDGFTKILGEPTVLSIKSSAYKMSGQRKGKWIRFGFPALPFEGIRKLQPSWYLQAQLEMAGSGAKQALIIVAAKDIVKVFENDEYLGPKGNGSLTFYAELIRPEPELIHEAIDINAKQLAIARSGEYGPAMYLAHDYSWVELEKAKVIPSDIWGGVNKVKTGAFNPCGGCNKRVACESGTA